MLISSEFHRHCCKPCELSILDIVSGFIQAALVAKAVEIFIVSLLEWSNFIANRFHGLEWFIMRIEVISIYRETIEIKDSKCADSAADSDFLPGQEHCHRGRHVKSKVRFFQWIHVIEFVECEVVRAHLIVVIVVRLGQKWVHEALRYRLHYSAVARQMAKESIYNEIASIFEHHHIIYGDFFHSLDFLPTCFATTYHRIIKNIVVHYECG